MLELIGLVICALIIFQTGKRLSILGEELADQTGLGQVWMGIILLSAVTSLPELMVGVSSTAIVGSADLAVGDILGSCAFNIFLLAIMDAFVPRNHALFGNVSGHHVIAAAMGIILLSIFVLARIVLLPMQLGPWIGYPSLLFLMIYFLAVRMIHGTAKSVPMPDQVTAAVQPLPSAGLKKVTLIRFAMNAFIIMLAALALPYVTDRLAGMIGISGSFAGTFILAATTSLPEVAVSLSAVRKGALDLAVGNLLGSNLFNFLILAVDDLVYPGADLLRDASSVHLISAVGTIIMVAIAIIGISIHARFKRLLLAWDALLIAMIYVIMLSLLYHTTS
jgi:cation:H+ antiporter